MAFRLRSVIGLVAPRVLAIIDEMPPQWCGGCETCDRMTPHELWALERSLRLARRRLDSLSEAA